LVSRSASVWTAWFSAGSPGVSKSRFHIDHSSFDGVLQMFQFVIGLFQTRGEFWVLLRFGRHACEVLSRPHHGECATLLVQRSSLRPRLSILLRSPDSSHHLQSRARRDPPGAKSPHFPRGIGGLIDLQCGEACCHAPEILWSKTKVTGKNVTARYSGLAFPRLAIMCISAGLRGSRHQKNGTADAATELT